MALHTCSWWKWSRSLESSPVLLLRPKSLWSFGSMFSNARVWGVCVCVCVCVLVAQSCLTFCHPGDYSLPGSSVHGIL